MTLAILKRYRSPLVAVCDFTCSAPAGHCSGEEAATADEIAIVRRGVFRRRAPSGTELLDPTRAAVLRRGEPYVVDHPGEDGDHSTVLAFSAQALADAFGRDATAPLAKLPAAVPLTRELLLAVHRLWVALGRAPVDTMLVDECALLALEAFRAAATSAGRSPHASGAVTRLGDEVRALLAARCTERITIGDLAKSLDTSPYHLCRRFRQATGFTIHQHLTALRMATALERMGDYRHDLARLALDLGYSSHSHFTTVFRGYFGVPPSAAAAGERFLAARKNLKAPTLSMQ